MPENKMSVIPDDPNTNPTESITVAEQQKPENTPQKLWNGALKLVKGENTAKLIEDFTAEMTLVAEGLCEDQTKLRREVDHLITEEDRHIQKVESKIDLVEKSVDEDRESFDKTVTELRNRIAVLEKKAAKDSSRLKSGKSIVRDLTWLVGIAAGAWVIVTIIQKFF